MNNAIPPNVAIFKEVTIEFVSANFMLLSWTLKSVFLPKHIDTAKKTNPGIIEIHANPCVLAYNISLVLCNTAARMHTNTKVIINKIWQMTNMYARIRWNKVFPIISPHSKQSLDNSGLLIVISAGFKNNLRFFVVTYQILLSYDKFFLANVIEIKWINIESLFIITAWKCIFLCSNWMCSTGCIMVIFIGANEIFLVGINCFIWIKRANP